eukprot:TRINITY_DN8904_c0_g2_i1.p1 TRINITY_DN8904_c0_g2~~TRINITY_DN8904_c0_g2_i1.p1  ORF type:complete len:456 (+),score=23.14 TRINITY_DN8904_c0_g2_i1:66-1433(+)
MTNIKFVNEVPWAGNVLLSVVIAGAIFCWWVAENMYPRDAETGNLQLIVGAFPMFTVLIIVEFILTEVTNFKHNTGRYNLADAWSSVSAGMTQQVLGKILCTHVIRLVPFQILHGKLHENGYPLHLPPAEWSSFWIAFLAYDFVYYWGHRHSHVYSFLWPGHGVHHSSDNYNLSTALRQSIWQDLTIWMWHLPLLLVGVHPHTFVLVSQVNTLYQFWVHTCLIRRLGFLEYIFVTPSHHRIHHDRRLHKNFAGVFILYDRLFGTFVDEGYESGLIGVQEDSKKVVELQDEVCFYGIVDWPRSWTECVTQTNGWVKLWEKGLFTLRGPGWNAATAMRKLPPTSLVERMRMEVHVTKPFGCYLLFQTILAVCSTNVIAACGEEVPPLHVMHVLTSLLVLGTVFDQKRSAVVLEPLRQVFFAVCFYYECPALSFAYVASLPFFVYFFLVAEKTITKVA